MDKAKAAAGIPLVIAGLIGVIFGLGVTLPGLMATRNANYSAVTASITEWTLMFLAGLVIVLDGIRAK